MPERSSPDHHPFQPSCYDSVSPRFRRGSINHLKVFERNRQQIVDTAEPSRKGQRVSVEGMRFETDTHLKFQFLVMGHVSQYARLLKPKALHNRIRGGMYLMLPKASSSGSRFLQVTTGFRNDSVLLAC